MSAVKAGMLGLIGSSYVLAVIFLCMLTLPYFFDPLVQQPLITSVLTFMLAQLLIFPLVSLFVCIITMALSLLLYFATFIFRE